MYTLIPWAGPEVKVPNQYNSNRTDNCNSKQAEPKVVGSKNHPSHTTKPLMMKEKYVLSKNPFEESNSTSSSNDYEKEKMKIKKGKEE